MNDALRSIGAVELRDMNLVASLYSGKTVNNISCCFKLAAVLCLHHVQNMHNVQYIPADQWWVDVWLRNPQVCDSHGTFHKCLNPFLIRSQTVGVPTRNPGFTSFMASKVLWNSLKYSCISAFSQKPQRLPVPYFNGPLNNFLFSIASHQMP